MYALSVMCMYAKNKLPCYSRFEFLVVRYRTERDELPDHAPYFHQSLSLQVQYIRFFAENI